MKRFLCVLISCVIAAAGAATAFAAQTTAPSHLLVLGDSIATGYGLSGYPSDANCYGRQLAAAFGLTGSGYMNLAKDGAATSDLVSLLATADGQSAVKAADTIEISIGGNNVLGPFLSAVYSALGLSSSATFSDLQKALATNPNAMALIAAKLSAADTLAQFQNGVTAFGSDFTKIIASLKTLNPGAHVYIQTVYNPFSGLTGYDALSLLADNYLGAINQAIAGGASSGGYTVVDVASAFKGKAAALTNMATSFDIHPNQDGHNLIFSLVYQSITGTAYSASSAASSGSAAASSSASASSGSAAPVSSASVSSGSAASASSASVSSGSKASAGSSSVAAGGSSADASVSSAASDDETSASSASSETGASSAAPNVNTGNAASPLTAALLLTLAAAAAVVLARKKN